jgi:hypothetical protein
MAGATTLRFIENGADAIRFAQGVILKQCGYVFAGHGPTPRPRLVNLRQISAVFVRRITLQEPIII